VPVPAQPPDHPVKLEPGAGEATSVTVPPFGSLTLQPSVDPVVQPTPPPLTVPDPVPATVTLSVYVDGWNVTVTYFAAFTYSVHVFGAPVTGVHPDQYLKTEPASAVPVSVTVWYPPLSAGFATKVVHPSVAPVAQLRPAPVIVPVPPPLEEAVTAKVAGSNFAVTYFALFMDTVQLSGAPVTGVQLPQLLKTELASGVAVSVTVLYAVVLPGFGTTLVHPSDEPVVQLRPAPAMVPAPFPVVAAMSVQVLGSNWAETYFAALMVTVQTFGEPLTGVHPDQLLKTELASGVAVSVTVLYAIEAGGFATWAVHPTADPLVQLRPAPEIVPTPFPDGDAVSVNVLGSSRTDTYLGPLT
jgi:hypothetical protein